MDQNEMLRTVAGATGLTRQRAEEAVIGTLTVLAETVSADETRDLLAQLPKFALAAVPVSGTTLTMRPIEFVARVADLTATSVDDAERIIRAVFAVLTDAVNAGEMNDIADELGDEYASLLGREARLQRAAAARRHGLPGAVGVLVGAVTSVIHSVVGAVQRPIDAGLRLGGLKR